MSKHEPKAHDLKVVSGVSIDGKIYAPGAVALGVADRLARELLGRGKVELATPDDVKSAAKAEKAAAAKADADADAAAKAEAEAKAKADADAEAAAKAEADAAAKAEAADKTPTSDKDKTK